MSLQRADFLTPAEYLELERRAENDRGCKFEHYRTLPSLTDYLTVAQDRPHIEYWNRRETGSSLVEYGDISQTIRLDSVGAILPLAEVYDKVDFDQ
ncbi:MAG TPA: hypothetical protein VKR61_04950 [Bryobacteraceae bacterium]|nr:hypothetical protein [Bryobacteraceae bacterium]